jgi:signal transduction histidine kinase
MSIFCPRWLLRTAVPGLLLFLPATAANAQTSDRAGLQSYDFPDTRELVALVKDAADLVRAKGEAGFLELRVPGSRWRQGETYIFVLDPDGTMLVHPDAAMEGRNQMDLSDINGRAVIRGLLGAVTTAQGKDDGWYHYEWPVPGGILPRWKSSYVQRVASPSGRPYVVGSGMYNDRMERTFVIDTVRSAIGRIEREGEAAFSILRDPTGPFIAKDAYVFVFDMNGVDLVNPAFPNLEGRTLLDVRDTHGKRLVREMLDLVRTRGSGWVDYMWPKPGQSVSTQKSTYVSTARIGEKTVLVGCGVYLADAPTAAPRTPTLTAPELMALVRDGAALLAKQGEQAYPQFREEGSAWFRDDTYFFVWTLDGTRVFHAADPAGEGQNVSGLKDVLGRPYGRMILDVAASPSGEGWIHYMHPEPGTLFPVWKSTFLKRVTFPSGRSHVLGSGIYSMRMDKAFIEDVVNRAAALIAARGTDAFAQLRDKTGPFVFLDTYIFVDMPDGTELVNPAQPSMEGTNVKGLKDVKGKALADEYIAAAMTNGSAWVEYYWYKPGQSTPARKLAFVRRVQSGGATYIVGSGLYVD